MCTDSSGLTMNEGTTDPEPPPWTIVLEESARPNTATCLLPAVSLLGRGRMSPSFLMRTCETAESSLAIATEAAVVTLSSSFFQSHCSGTSIT